MRPAPASSRRPTSCASQPEPPPADLLVTAYDLLHSFGIDYGPYVRLCEHFLARIEGRTPPTGAEPATFADGVANMAVLDAIRVRCGRRLLPSGPVITPAGGAPPPPKTKSATPGDARDLGVHPRNPDLVEGTRVRHHRMHEGEVRARLAHEIGHEEVEEWIVVERAGERRDGSPLLVRSHAPDFECVETPSPRRLPVTSRRSN